LKRGPGSWAEFDTSYRMCAAEVGKKQSPVNIVTAQTIGAAFQPLVFTGKAPALALVNTDHAVEVEYAEGNTVKTGSQPTDLYALKQWHLHVPSEHRIDGREYAAELHLVYQNSVGEVLVVALLMDEKLAPSANLDRVIQSFPRRKGSVPGGSGVPSLDSLLPARRNFYRYAGSFTTPACAEGVEWFVMANAVGITPSNVKTLHGLVGAFTGYDGYPNNNRPPAGLNGRTILRSLP
jgi:carbonic anhydrase